MMPNRRRILVVDPDPGSCENVARFLDSLGYRVATAYDGNRALNIGLGTDIDLAILDAHLPVYDGPELLAMLRRRHLARPLKVIAFATCNCATTLASFETHRVDRVLTKPVDLTLLRESVTRLVPSHAQLEFGLHRSPVNQPVGADLVLA